MMLSDPRVLLAGAGSLALLIGALGFQFLGGLAPCPMCLWQRWPHLAAVVIALAALPAGAALARALSGLGAATMVLSAGLGIYHGGVERGWWEGPSSCSASAIDGKTADELLAEIMAAPLVRCDEIVWEFLGLTMAGWNAVISVGLCLLWIGAASWSQDSSSASQ